VERRFGRVVLEEERTGFGYRFPTIFSRMIDNDDIWRFESEEFLERPATLALFQTREEKGAKGDRRSLGVNNRSRPSQGVTYSRDEAAVKLGRKI
jgi:hypothetical protein